MQKNPAQSTCSYVIFKSIEQGGDLVKQKKITGSRITLLQKSSMIEATVIASGNSSDLYFLAAFSAAEEPKFRMHFGVAAVHNGQWSLENDDSICQGSCLLLHHMGDGICLEVLKDLDDAKEAMQVFEDVPLDVHEFAVGSSQDAVKYFLGARIFNKQLRRKYSSAYIEKNGKFFEFGQTNCLRLALDTLLCLKAPRSVAEEVLGVGRDDDYGPKSEIEASAIAVRNAVTLLNKHQYLSDLRNILSIYEALKAMPHERIQDRFIGQLDRTYHLDKLFEVFLEAYESEELRVKLEAKLQSLLDSKKLSRTQIVSAICNAFREQFGFMQAVAKVSMLLACSRRRAPKGGDDAQKGGDDDGLTDKFRALTLGASST